MDTRLVTDAVAAASAVPGLAIGDVSAQPGLGDVAVVADLVGWGPSLHALRMRWTLRIGATLRCPPVGLIGRWRHSRTLRSDLAAALAPHLARQKARAARAAVLGLSAPIPMADIGDAAADPASLDISGIAIDRHVLAIQVQACSKHGPATRESVLAQLRLDVAASHDTDLAGRTGDGREAHGHNPVRRTASTLAPIVRADGSTGSIILPSHALSLSPASLFDGRTLTFMAQLPESALPRIAGMRLGDVVETGTPVDDRPVHHALTAGEGSGLVVEPDAVLIGDLAEHPTADTVAAMAPA